MYKFIKTNKGDFNRYSLYSLSTESALVGFIMPSVLQQMMKPFLKVSANFAMAEVQS